MQKLVTAASLTFLLLIAGAQVQAQAPRQTDWPQFRGRNRIRWARMRDWQISGRN